MIQEKLNKKLSDQLPLSREEKIKPINWKSAPLIANEWVDVVPNDSLAKIQEDLRSYMPDTPIVFGSGKPHAQLMVIDQSPSETELREGVPFLNRTGQLATKMLSAIGLSREECYLTYAIKCRKAFQHNSEDEIYDLLDNEELPDYLANFWDEIRQMQLIQLERPSRQTVSYAEGFRSFLLREILAVKPRVVLSFSGLPTRVILRTEEWVSRLRGMMHTLRLNNHEFVIVTTFQPSLLLHLPERKEDAWEDLKIVRDCLKGRK